MAKRIKLFTISAVVIGGVLAAQSAHAAVLSMSPKSGSLKINQDFVVELLVNTNGVSFNAAQATIEFPPKLLEVKSISTAPEDSIFNFWLDGPTFSNKDGKISFIGGTSNGVSGPAIPILRVVFTAKASGEAALSFSDTAVTAADGSGTNILDTVEVASFKISSEVAAPAAKPIILKAAAPEPVLITRTATLAKELPGRPVISIPFYPDEDQWYDHISNFLAQWKLSSDITDVSADIDRNVSYASKESQGLFESKIFPGIGDDGVWYFHVRFKNNIGWGPVGNYKINIDTLPPKPFKIGFVGGAANSDEPSRTVKFETADNLSGIDRYEVSLDKGGSVVADKRTYQSSLQPPGMHSIKVRAFDKAGNFIEDFVDFEVLPLEAPTIDAVTPDVFIGEGNLVVSGTALTGTELSFDLRKGDGSIVYHLNIPINSSGLWKTVIDQPLKKDKYHVEIQSKDGRGALSLPVISSTIRVRERPLFTLGGLEVTQFGFFFGLIVILLGAFGSGFWAQRLWKKQLGRKLVIAGRDVVSVFGVIKKDLDNVLSKYSDQKISAVENTEIGFLLKKTKADLEKMQKYITDNINDLSR